MDGRNNPLSLKLKRGNENEMKGGCEAERDIFEALPEKMLRSEILKLLKQTQEISDGASSVAGGK